MRNLVARCLQKDHKQRPSARELLEDKFFKVRVDYLEKGSSHAGRNDQVLVAQYGTALLGINHHSPAQQAFTSSSSVFMCLGCKIIFVGDAAANIRRLRPASLLASLKMVVSPRLVNQNTDILHQPWFITCVLPNCCHCCCIMCLQQARDAEFLQRTLVLGLPALGERVQQIRVGKAATLAAENDKQLEKSQVRRTGSILLAFCHVQAACCCCAAWFVVCYRRIAMAGAHR
jgi:hypothetical protein